MRIAAIAVLVWVSATPLARADDDSTLEWVENNLSGGFNVGLGLAWLGGDDIDNNTMSEFKAKAAPALGLAVALRATQMFAMQLEARLTSKGGSFTDNTGIDGAIGLHYLEFPVLAKLQVPAWGNTNLYGYGGLSLQVLVRATVTDQFGQSINISDDLETAGVDLVVGAGASVGQMTFDLRGQLGTSSIKGEPGSDTQTRVASVLAGYMF